MQSDACWSQFPNSSIIWRVTKLPQNCLKLKCEERDLGICVTDNLKLSAQCLKAANKAMTVL